jgi:hypothetical protein
MRGIHAWHTEDVELLSNFIAVDLSVVFAVQAFEYAFNALQLRPI